MTLHELNTLPRPQLIEELTKCSSSAAWVNKMLPFFPADDLVELLEDAEQQWYQCNEEDWKEAFTHHSMTGDAASDEQSGIAAASQQTMKALAEGKRRYQEKFGYIFIVCAAGKSAEEIVVILQTRLQNNPDAEIEVAADEQNMITKLRLEKLLDT